VAQKYGLEIIGEDYQLEVTGHSLGAALSTVFSFYASCLPDERFTKDKPIKGKWSFSGTNKRFQGEPMTFLSESALAHVSCLRHLFANQ